MPTVVPEAMNDAACSALMILERNLLQPIRMSPINSRAVLARRCTSPHCNNGLIQINAGCIGGLAETAGRPGRALRPYGSMDSTASAAASEGVPEGGRSIARASAQPCRCSFTAA